jgi:cytochrome c peroxidase
MWRVFAMTALFLGAAEREALLPFPVLAPGDPAPQQLYRYTGKGAITYDGVDRIADFVQWKAAVAARKAQVQDDRANYLATRYDWKALRLDDSLRMSGGRKALPRGPVTRLPNSISDWERLAELPPAEIRRRDLFPEGFRPLSHPLHSIGHMLFPKSWTDAHPEHKRFDIDHDLPDAYLPEFPPPLFLTTRPDLGDISQGREITLENHREFFDGVLTPEQMEGARLLLTKFPTSWFNFTKHRVTAEPSRGVACFDCHVNGHTNGALGLDPGTRPQLARVRLDTPSIRGNHVMSLFSLKRSIRTLDHFAEVEEYFDGDIAMQLQVGGRQLDKPSTNRMGDFMSIVGFPPAEKLDRLGRLIPAKATEQERRGETLFFGKAQCGTCHPAPFYTDNRMHDLRVEEFHLGRAEGWAKTFSLRGIKDSPPYFHDGRLLTLEDTVEFFNLLLGAKLNAAEKRDLVSFLRCL